MILNYLMRTAKIDLFSLNACSFSFADISAEVQFSFFFRRSAIDTQIRRHDYQNEGKSAGCVGQLPHQGNYHNICPISFADNRYQNDYYCSCYIVDIELMQTHTH